MRFFKLLPFALAVLVVPSVLAQEETQGLDPVLAVVNGMEIRRSEVVESARSLPPEYQTQVNQILPALLERYIDLKLIDEEALGKGLGEDAEVEKRLAQVKEDIVREVYISRYLDKRVTEEGLQARYQEFLKTNPPQPEVHARHILVPTKEEAVAVIEQLNSGKDFAAVAAELSKGGSAQSGGDLGYFLKEDMVPEFSEAAFAMQPGETSKEPVETRFGWHVIKVDDRRDRQPPSFEEVKGNLRSEAQQEVVTALIQDLRASAKIEIKTPAAPEAGGAAPAPESEEADPPAVE